MLSDNIKEILEENSKSKAFNELCEIVSNQDIDTLTSVLEQPEYLQALKLPPIKLYLTVHPVNLAIQSGNLDVLKVLISRGAVLDSNMLAPILDMEIQQAHEFLEWLSTRIEPDNVRELLNNDALKKVMIRKNKFGLLHLLMSQYQFSPIFENGTSMRYHASRSRRFTDGELFDELGLTLTGSDRFLILLQQVTDNQDLEGLETLTQHPDKFHLLNVDHLSGLLQAFSEPEALPFLMKMSQHFTLDDFLGISETFLDESFEKDEDPLNWVFLSIIISNYLNLHGTSFSKNPTYYGSVLGVRGDIVSDYITRIESSSNITENLQYLSHLYTTYIKSRAHEEHAELLRAINDGIALSVVNEQAQIEQRKKILDNEQLVLMPGFSENHIYGISLIKGHEGKYYVGLTNRGGGAHTFGTFIYEINEEQAHKIIETFSECELKLLQTTTLRPQEENNRIFQEIIGQSKLIHTLPATGQKFGTCGYVNPKRSLEAGLYLIGLRDQNEQLKQKASERYKAFSNATRKIAIEELSEQLREKPDSEVLQQLAQKYILSQHSPDKHGGIEVVYGKMLLSLLPEEQQNVLRNILQSPINDMIKNVIIDASLSELPLALTVVKFCHEKGLISTISSIEVQGNGILIRTAFNESQKQKLYTALTKTDIKLKNHPKSYSFEILTKDLSPLQLLNEGISLDQKNF